MVRILDDRYGLFEAAPCENAFNGGVDVPMFDQAESTALCGLSAFPYMGIAVPVNGATSQDTFYCAHVVVCRIFADMLNL